MPLSVASRLRPVAWLTLSLLGTLSFPAAADAWTVTAPAGVELKTIAAGGSGSTVAAGTQWVAGQQALYVSKHSSAGELLWETLLSEGSISGELRALAVSPTGDIYAIGSQFAGDGRSTILAACFRGSDGRILWNAMVSPPAMGAVVLEGSADAIAIGGRGELVVGGYVLADGGTAAIVSRLDPRSGRPVWTWSAPQATVTDLAIDRRGCVLVTGSFFLAAKLRGTDGAQLWRIDSPSASLQERGYPQMRSLSVDSKGNVTVGGSLRNTLEDTRSFLVTKLASTNGKRLAETAGPPLYTFESAVQVLPCGSDVIAAGRVQGEPSILRLRGTAGAPRWVQRPWSVDDSPDRTTGVADVTGGSSGIYALGTDYPGSLVVTAFTATGKARWTHHIGDGSGVRLILVGRELFVLGTQPAPDGPRSVLLSLDARTGASLD